MGEVSDVVALWQACGLTRPWNDPVADAERAITGPTSTILGLRRDPAPNDPAPNAPGLSGPVLIGTVMAGFDGHRGWIHYLAVAAEHRGSGHGRALMSAAEDWLRDHGAPKVQLMVRSSNRTVVDFYTALGYGDQEVVVLGRFLDPELQRLREGSQTDR